MVRWIGVVAPRGFFGRSSPVLIKRVQVENGPGVTPRRTGKPRPFTRMASEDQGFVVKGDTPGITVTLPKAKGASK